MVRLSNYPNDSFILVMIVVIIFILNDVVIGWTNSVVFSFQTSTTTTRARATSSSNTKCYNFFKKAFDDAFANDRNLSSDKGQGQYDNIFTGEEFVDMDIIDADEGLTDVQKRWRQMQLSTKSNSNNLNNNNANTGSSVVDPNSIASCVSDSSILLDLFLAGVPQRDPSNDLYGSRVNISTRDKDTNLSLPNAPSVTGVRLDMQNNGVCKVYDSSFTTENTDGQWKISDDGKVLRFAFESLGYTRTIETKGSIQNVYWTDEEQKTVQTSTTYTIPPGSVYGDVDIRVIPQRQSFDLERDGVGILRVEQSTGMFGISSKMIPCGKFRATRNNDSINNE